jgi:endogenous inhibitor of DNA gyrase (YacG/DUF329 family)
MGAKRTYVGILTKQCEGCGMDVTRKASAFREHVFCSRRCYVQSDYHRCTVSAANKVRNPIDTHEEVPCLACGTSIVRNRSQFRGRRAFCNSACRSAYRAESAEPQITEDGYVRLFVGRGSRGADKSGHILEHRKVMQDYLDRALFPHENVHHVHGDKSDNRLENLELWTTSQPSGQRVEDKLAWARDFLAQYSEQEQDMLDRIGTS